MDDLSVFHDCIFHNYVKSNIGIKIDSQKIS